MSKVADFLDNQANLYEINDHYFWGVTSLFECKADLQLGSLRESKLDEALNDVVSAGNLVYGSRSGDTMATSCRIYEAGNHPIKLPAVMVSYCHGVTIDYGILLDSAIAWVADIGRKFHLSVSTK